MKDWLKKTLKNLFNHERYQTLSVIAAGGMLLWMLSCQPMANSLLDPTKKVTQVELEGEIALLQSRIDKELQSLEQQAAIRNLLLNLAQTYATTGTFNPLSALTGAIALLATGAVIDNGRKRREIKKLEA